MPNYTLRRILVFVAFCLIVWGIVWSVRKTVSFTYNKIKYSRIKVVTAQLKPGQVLFDSLLENKVSRDDANKLLASLAKILDLTKLQVSDEYRLYIGPDKEIQKLIYEKSPIDEYFVVLDDYGNLHSFKPEIILNKETITKEFMIKSSLFAAMKQAGEEDALAFKFVDVFAWDIDFFTYPRIGDKITIYFEKYSKDGQFAKYGRILAAEYKGREIFQTVYFEPKNNEAGYYGLDGKPTEKMFLKSPLKFTGRITSYFGGRRDPITSRHSNHSGVDFASYYGAPIVATSSGIVSFAGWKGYYGRLITVKHSNGYTTYYGHCSKSLVRPGQSVAQGQIIAKVGSTGRSTGPHVHYEIRQQGGAFNPLRFNQPQRKPLKDKDLKDFKQYAKNIWQHITENR
ncbi:MAG: M23 family metallopeptidase [bacterium]